MENCATKPEGQLTDRALKTINLMPIYEYITGKHRKYIQNIKHNIAVKLPVHNSPLLLKNKYIMD